MKIFYSLAIFNCFRHYFKNIKDLFLWSTLQTEYYLRFIAERLIKQDQLKVEVF